MNFEFINLESDLELDFILTLNLCLINVIQ